MAEALTDNFNDHSKGVVFERNLDRDVIDEPLLIKVEGDRYLVHENSGWNKLAGEGEGWLKSYSKEAFDEKFGDIEMRTYGQYKADAEVLNTTPGLGRQLDENKDFMQFRLKEIEQDMAKAGETFEVKAPETALNNTLVQ